MLIGALLQNVTIHGDRADKPWAPGAQYFVEVYIANEKVVESTYLKSRSPVLEWKWNGTGHPIWFEPSSTIKIILRRKSRSKIKLFDHVLGQHEGKIVDMLGSDTSFDLMDEKGEGVNTQLKISISPTPKTDDVIKAFMAKIDADVSRLSGNGSVLSTISTLGQILQLTKSIMDKVSQAHPILNVSWIVVSSIYQAVQEAGIQDESILELASTLHELLGAAAAVPNLPEIPNTKNVIESICRQSLQVASLIDEYTKLSRAERTIRITVAPGGLKSRIAECQKSCAALEKKLFNRVQIDTRTQAHQSGRKLAAIVDDQLAEKILKWLSPPDSSRNRNEAHDKRQADTCSWFLNSDRFRHWKESPSFIWVHGKPGCGKSILCSSIIDELELGTTPLIVLGYFIFDGRDGQTDLQLHSKLLRSLVCQFTFGLDGSIPAELANLYRGCGNGTRQPLDDQLEGVLHGILNIFTQCYIVIDALDECTDYPKTVAWVAKLVTRQQKTNLHIIVSSRPEQNIKEVLGELDPSSLNVSEATENNDITVYLESQMASKLKFKKYNEDMRNKIETRLIEGADGSFRWAALQLDELGKCSSADEIDKQLAELPEGLDETYNRILKKIDNKYLAHTKTFLEWLAFSLRPLTINELAETITVDVSNTSDGGLVFDPRKRYFNPQDVLVRCSSLVSTSEGIIKLSHFSVKEYLISDRITKDFAIDEKRSHSRMSETSMAYLQQYNSVGSLTEDLLITSPLAKYAARYWADHANHAGVENALLKSIIQFFSNGASFSNWTCIHNVEKSWEDDMLTDPPDFTPLYLASLSGWQQVVEHLLKNGENPKVQGGYFGNALQAASYEGHREIVELLLDHGADVNMQGGYYGNALQVASYKGHREIVELLLDKGAEVNMQGGFYGNALQAACNGGDREIVELLLDQRADINMQGGEFGNALQAACSGGDREIVELLLDQRADINMQGGEFGNALQAACSGGHQEIMKLLLDKGAEVNMQGGWYGNALQVACSGGDRETVELLLDKGAEVNMQGGFFGNALQVACSGGDREIVELLLDKGAEVNMQGGFMGSALQDACSGGYREIVELLLDHGADVNMQEGHFGNALQVASYGGDREIVELLLDKGAGVNIQGGFDGNALQAACSGGDRAIVKLLLDQGAEVNMQGGFFGNALQAASCRGHREIVELLLDKGADVSMQGGRYGNALQAACSGGHQEIMKLLLDKGAEVNMQGGWYGNALQAASYKGHRAVVELLLEKGAEVNMQGGEFGNALQAASYEGHREIVELLLDQGADVNMQGGWYGNALRAASISNSKEILALLVAHGAIEQPEGP